MKLTFRGSTRVKDLMAGDYHLRVDAEMCKWGKTLKNHDALSYVYCIAPQQHSDMQLVRPWHDIGPNLTTELPHPDKIFGAEQNG